MAKIAEDDIYAAILAAVGDNDETQGVTSWHSTGYLPLDQAISGLKEGGGFPSGRIIELAGAPSSGKTVIATRAMISCQRAGGIPMFFDHERSFEKRLAVKLGLDITPGRFIFKTPRTFEDSIDQFLAIAELIRNTKGAEKKPMIAVFDSLASMIPQAQLEKESGKLGMNDQTALSRATSLNFKVLALRAEELDVCILFLNQVRNKPGISFGDPRYTVGGDAPKFYASVRIMLGAQRIMLGGEVVGQNVDAQMIKNKVNRPFLKTSWKFMYQEDGSGKFDTVGSLLDILVDKGVLNKVGKGRIEFVDGSKHTRSELIARLEAAPNGVKILEKLLIDHGVELDTFKEGEMPAAEDVAGDE